MPFWAADFIGSRSVRLMPTDAVGLYVILLCNEWIDGALPENLTELAMLIGRPVEEVSRLWPHLEPHFEKTDAGYINQRLEIEREKQLERSKKRAESGRIGGEKSGAKRRQKAKSKQTRSKREAKTKHSEPYPESKPYPETEGCQSEESLPASPGEAGGRASPSIVSEMQSEVERTVERLRLTGRDRTRFVSSAHSLIADEGAWAFDSDEHVPLDARPRILRLALARVEAEESKTLKGAIQYAALQQFRPFQQKQASGVTTLTDEELEVWQYGKNGEHKPQRNQVFEIEGWNKGKPPADAQTYKPTPYTELNG